MPLTIRWSTFARPRLPPDLLPCTNPCEFTFWNAGLTIQALDLMLVWSRSMDTVAAACCKAGGMTDIAIKHFQVDSPTSSALKGSITCSSSWLLVRPILRPRVSAHDQALPDGAKLADTTSLYEDVFCRMNGFDRRVNGDSPSCRPTRPPAIRPYTARPYNQPIISWPEQPSSECFGRYVALRSRHETIR